MVEADGDHFAISDDHADVLPPLRGRFAMSAFREQASMRHWGPAEVDLASVVAGRCWGSLQRVQADRERREGGQRYRLLFERATDAIWVLDREWRFVEVNPAACALLGRTRDELVGTSVADLVVPGRGSDLRRLDADVSDAPVVTEVWRVRHGEGCGRVGVEHAHHIDRGWPWIQSVVATP